MPKLILLKGPEGSGQTGDVFPLGRAMLIIGREPVSPDSSVPLQLSCETVSKNHASIVYENEDYYLRDNGSTNGSLVNNLPIESGKPYLLQQGDRIRFGSYEFLVDLFGSSGESTPEDTGAEMPQPISRHGREFRREVNLAGGDLKMVIAGRSAASQKLGHKKLPRALGKQLEGYGIPSGPAVSSSITPESPVPIPDAVAPAASSEGVASDTGSPWNKGLAVALFISLSGMAWIYYEGVSERNRAVARLEAQYQNESVEHKRALESFKTQVAALQLQNTGLVADKEELFKEITEVKGLLAQARAEKEAIEKRVAERMNGKIGELQKKFSQLNVEHDRLKKNASESEKELRKKLAKLQGDLSLDPDNPEILAELARRAGLPEKPLKVVFLEEVKVDFEGGAGTIKMSKGAIATVLECVGGKLKVSISDKTALISPHQTSFIEAALSQEKLVKDTSLQQELEKRAEEERASAVQALADKDREDAQKDAVKQQIVVEEIKDGSLYSVLQRVPFGKVRVMVTGIPAAELSNLTKGEVWSGRTYKMGLVEYKKEKWRQYSADLEEYLRFKKAGAPE